MNIDAACALDGRSKYNVYLQPIFKRIGGELQALASGTQGRETHVAARSKHRVLLE